MLHLICVTLLIVATLAESMAVRHWAKHGGSLDSQMSTSGTTVRPDPRLSAIELAQARYR